jgi:GntR family transcriptional regulator
MIPFQIRFRSGVPVYRQLIYAVKRACLTGAIKPGDKFPSVRQISLEARINPNTVHKAVAQLTDEGILEVRAGLGTFVAPPRTEKQSLLNDELEPIVLEAKNLGLSLDDVIDATRRHWKRLEE